MMSRVLVGLLVLVGSLFILLAVSGEAVGATWIVDDDNGSWTDFQTIQDAINGSSDGDTIWVYNGTYFENVIVDQAVTILGNGSNGTIIDGGELSDVVKIKSDNVELISFIVKNSRDKPFNHNSGVVIRNVTNCTIRNNVIIRNDCGIFLSKSHGITVVNNTILKNYNGIEIDNSSSNIFKNNDIINWKGPTHR